MSKINTFAPANLTQVRASLNAAMAAVAKEYGIALTLGKITFDDRIFRCTLEASCVAAPAKSAKPGGKEPVVLTASEVQAREAWARFAGLDGMDKRWLGKQITLGGKSLKIVGYMPRNPKSPVALQDENGAKFKCTPGAVIRAMAARA